MNQHPKIPILMYHSVGIPDKTWQNNYLTCPYKVFEKVLIALKKKGYYTLTFQQLYEYIFNNKPVPSNSVILTFDDGYLDNYVFAYPLLKKYGLKGCIFPSTDFIKDGEKRETLENIDDPTKLKATTGFLYWSELKEMEDSGVMEIQCHAQTHTFFEIGPSLIDFRHQNDHYYWKTWNDYPYKKPLLIKDDPDLIKYGTPIFEHKPSLALNRFFLSPKIEKDLFDFIHTNKLHEVYSIANREKVKVYFKELISDSKNVGEYESEEEYRKRIMLELITSKELLEKKLSKEITVLCWPHGSSTVSGVKIADQLGFKLNTAGRDILNIRHLLINSPDKKTNRVYRLPVGGYWNRLHYKDTKISYLGKYGIIIRIKLFQTTSTLKILLKVINKLIKYYHKMKVKISFEI